MAGAKVAWLSGNCMLAAGKKKMLYGNLGKLPDDLAAHCPRHFDSSFVDKKC